MLVEVSTGEALDKLSILEIKSKLLVEPSQVAEVSKELQALSEVLRHARDRWAFRYKMLLHVNRQIWDLTNRLWSIGGDHADYADVARQIFEQNRVRFRMKNAINRESHFREQKSYAQTTVHLQIDNEEELYSGLSTINALAVRYDNIVFVASLPSLSTIYPEFESKVDGPADATRLASLRRPDDEELFCFSPISYVAGGLLGDFIHQLGVVHANYLKTGRKGRVFLSEHGDAFRFGRERAYADLKEIVLAQAYVESFEIHTGQSFDVNLSAWRQSPLLYKADWRSIFESTFDISWGARPWLKLEPDREYADCILIGMSLHRRPDVDWNFLNHLPGRALFVTTDPREIANWRAMTGAELPSKVFSSLHELYRAIGSCKLYIGNMSAALAAAVAFHQRAICLCSNGIDDVHILGLERQWRHFEYVLRNDDHSPDLFNLAG